MKSALSCLTLVFFASWLPVPLASAAETGELSTSRIADIANWLPEKPAGFGRPINDRPYWSSPEVVAKANVKEAEKLLNKEFPAWDDQAYLEFSVQGTRPNGEKMENRRSSWLAPLVLAECVENKGRFLPLINKILEAYASEPSWALPAADRNLKIFYGQQYDIELRSAAFAHELAQTLYMLGDKIDPAVRKHVEAVLEQRVFAPFRRALSTGFGCYWLGNEKHPVQNNWNCVCLAGVVGAAQTIIADKQERALYVAAGEHYTRYYLNSIPMDGYCGEGVGYWGYGFGHLAMLREEIIEATSGKLDLFSNSRILDNALYGTRILIGPAAVPPFADCPFGGKVSEELVAYCNEVMNLGLKTPPFEGMKRDGLPGILMGVTPCAKLPTGVSKTEDPLRFYFREAGVLACRPSPGGAISIGIKAGGNGSHSHNDIGSYEIAMGNDEPTGDPGGPHYDRSTFSPQRYEHKILNSYGHPVPVVGGKLQVLAAKAKPIILSTSFTPERDEITMDITSAYDVPSLVKLTRKMEFMRGGSGEIKISDEVVFREPTTFEDALVTHGQWKQLDAKTLELTLGQSKLLVLIDSSAPFHFKPEQIDDQGIVFTRIGLMLDNPALNAKMTMLFKPSL